MVDFLFPNHKLALYKVGFVSRRVRNLAVQLKTIFNDVFQAILWSKVGFFTVFMYILTE